MTAGRRAMHSRAVECDGDRYHPMDKLAEDMARQAILERLGWTFARIRGTAFYRNPELAMRLVFDRLRELAIPQEAGSHIAPESDMTLIHELDDLTPTESEAEIGELTNKSMDPTLTGREGDDEPPTQATGWSAAFDHGEIEALLHRLGGTAPFESFLRQLAQTKGFRRLGHIIRKNFEAELAILVRSGKISISSGIVRLL